MIRRDVLRQWALTAILLGLSYPASAEGASTPIALQPVTTVAEGTFQVSPPALEFDGRGHLHLAWIDKQGETSRLRALRVDRHGKPIGQAVQVNPAGTHPSALHQAPGLAAGREGHVAVTWSSAPSTADTPFANHLELSVSHDDGATFAQPVRVNDDAAAISHSFENVQIDPAGNVYVSWLDNRTKEKSGAAAIFACSRDGGRTVGTNVIVDGMACPCCRATVKVAPNGTLWLAWRKTFENNVRDIVVAQSSDQGKTFSPPILVHQDGWSFPACPHRGPSLGFDDAGRMYVGWYTEGTDEQPRLFVSTSDDEGKTFSPAVSLHTSTTSLPDQLRMAVHPKGAVVAVWEEVTGVRKRTVMRVSVDRGASFGPVQPLSDGAKAEYPTVAIEGTGHVAISWTEHAWPHNRIVLRQGRLDPTRMPK